jgi:hypothetical protein
MDGRVWAEKVQACGVLVGAHSIAGMGKAAEFRFAASEGVCAHVRGWIFNERGSEQRKVVWATSAVKVHGVPFDFAQGRLSTRSAVSHSLRMTELAMRLNVLEPPARQEAKISDFAYKSARNTTRYEGKKMDFVAG